MYGASSIALLARLWERCDGLRGSVSVLEPSTFFYWLRAADTLGRRCRAACRAAASADAHIRTAALRDALVVLSGLEARGA